jgi:hypothetical protein
VDEVTPLPSALQTVQQTKSLIHELELSLPNSSAVNFRERIEACLEQNCAEPKVKALLEMYETVFGVPIP